MKYTIITLVIVLLACMATADFIKGQQSSQITSEEAPKPTHIEDEYWPFEKTVTQSDPSLLEVAKKLERAD